MVSYYKACSEIVALTTINSKWVSFLLTKKKIKVTHKLTYYTHRLCLQFCLNYGFNVIFVIHNTRADCNGQGHREVV